LWAYIAHGACSLVFIGRVSVSRRNLARSKAAASQEQARSKPEAGQ
jgi:hypothetical protein